MVGMLVFRGAVVRGPASVVRLFCRVCCCVFCERPCAGLPARCPRCTRINEETSLKVLENEALLQDIMRKAADVDIDVKPTCAPQFTRVADQLGIPTRYTRGCLAGLTYCVIGSEGIVRPCAYMTEDAGDVREQPFDEIWATSPVFERLRTQAYGGNCGECEHKKHCGGCRARAAYYHDGDYMAQDDYCAYGQKLGCMGA